MGKLPLEPALMARFMDVLDFQSVSGLKLNQTHTKVSIFLNLQITKKNSEQFKHKKYLTTNKNNTLLTRHRDKPKIKK